MMFNRPASQPPPPDRPAPVLPHLGLDASFAARARLALVSRSVRRIRTAGIGLFLAAALAAHLLTVLAIVALPRLEALVHPKPPQPSGQATIEMVMEKTPTVGGSKPQAPAAAHPQAKPAQPKPAKTANAPPPLTSPNATDQLSASSEDAVTAPAAESPASPPDAKPGQQPLPRVNLDPSGDPGYGEATGQNVTPANPDSANINQPPIYPDAAARRGEEGAVFLVVTVAPDGHPAHVEIASSSGHKILDDEALRAVSRWHFHPETQDGKPVQSFFNQEIEFGLHER